ncbi:DUF5412 domain-containing protein [Oceanobacillus luteolus]|uniref:DUF5412 family protein n=1 Tax=Oceanobacillus luteolus TaxID=1274358 RepID=UPI00203D2712|nr:DUF5412 family protein [Oceanobacillus luteolus]MCM3740299.1 DUF5412 domain-containing protein [Oceanobacillus luteolus]
MIYQGETIGQQRNIDVKMGDFVIIILGFLLSIITVILFLVLCARIIVSFIKKKPFPKRLLIVTLFGMVLISSLYIYETYFFTFNDIDRDSIQMGPGPITSPNGTYTAHAYYELYGGAAGGVNMWVEITNNKEKDKTQTVYYSSAMNNTSLHWLSEDKLFIQNKSPQYPNSNRSIQLEIGKEIYHENGLACKSLLMKDEYETCYQN